MKKFYLIPLLIIIAHLSFGQIKNGGFEVYDSLWTTTYESDLINLYSVQNPVGGNPSAWINQWSYGICRTTDSYSGSYALILFNWYTYVNSYITYHDTIHYKPLYLQGYYKYIDDDTTRDGIATVVLTRFNGSFSDTIATGSLIFDSVTHYTPFQVTLNYISALTPDSIHLYIRNSYTVCQGFSNVCKLLYLDDLTLTDTPVNVESSTAAAEDGIKIYPSPLIYSSTLKLNIHPGAHLKDAEVIIYNILGKEMMRKKLTGDRMEIRRENFTSGVYFVKVTGEGKQWVGKMAVE